MMTRLPGALLFVALAGATGVCAQTLASWEDTGARRAIVRFVDGVTDPSSEAFVPPAQRIAVFDNDGTLWSEQPAYFQLLFAVDRVRDMAPAHPAWREQEPFRSVLTGDLEGLASQGMHAVLELVMATHAGTTTDEFAQIAGDWVRTATHPRFDRPFVTLVYQPMVELLDYLRANGFSTWIVSGGGIDFMRPWTEEAYGIPPEQVVGSSIDTTFEMRNGEPALVRLPEMNFIDDGPGKPVGIHRHIGRRPLVAFGNSDGDLEMLRWTAAGDGARFVAIVHHTDAEREWAYDRDSSVGRLDAALDEARDRNWLLVDMKRDWKRVYPAASAER